MDVRYRFVHTHRKGEASAIDPARFKKVNSTLPCPIIIQPEAQSISLPLHDRHRAELDSLVGYPCIMTCLHNLRFSFYLLRISTHLLNLNLSTSATEEKSAGDCGTCVNLEDLSHVLVRLRSFFHDKLRRGHA